PTEALPQRRTTTAYARLMLRLPEQSGLLHRSFTELVDPHEHRPSALDPPEHEPVALVRLVVVGAEAHVRARPAVDGRQQVHLLEPLLHAARREQRGAREALGDQPRGVVAERGDGVVAALAVAGGEAVEHGAKARVLFAHLVDAVPALERCHPLRL